METRIIRSLSSPATILDLQKLYLFTSRDNLLLKYHIQLNQLWLLMQYSQISGYIHYLSQERNMFLEVFPIDDLYSTVDDCKKIGSLQ
ncbi:hypothetical protein BHE74_00036718 [Ensete ventricosum]|nr:hypothetical protein GW17_00041360 [Ensete ventricosum]RWW56555.1 hypothetical protein BHE74_00036718 [Ensete ventricosum]RZS00077.1 hypothetical protein BHM03_00029716 [Ensete ventricosum]